MASREEVLKVAVLARIRLEEKDIEKVQQRFSAILEHFQFLSEVPTEGIAPLFHGLEEMNLRQDIPEAPLNPVELLQNAPEQLDDCFKLPKVVGAAE
jgi:aspartyl-tRNA(Asn)/glutamyl-tRNA(Gln) amidotransferase subunit C